MANAYLANLSPFSLEAICFIDVVYNTCGQVFLQIKTHFKIQGLVILNFEGFHILNIIVFRTMKAFLGIKG